MTLSTLYIHRLKKGNWSSSMSRLKWRKMHALWHMQVGRMRMHSHCSLLRFLINASVNVLSNKCIFVEHLSNLEYQFSCYSTYSFLFRVNLLAFVLQNDIGVYCFFFENQPAMFTMSEVKYVCQQANIISRSYQRHMKVFNFKRNQF